MKDVRQIIQAGQEVLRVQAQELSREEILSESTRELIEHMKETMRHAPGVGLAAPQVGISQQLAVIEDREEYQKKLTAEQLAERQRHPVPFHVIINPRIVSSDSISLEFFEGCLSVAGYSALVPRARAVRVEYLNELGEAKKVHAIGWYARILQHEIDHLNGVLYVDRMRTRSLATIENYMRYLRHATPEELRAALGIPAEDY